MTRAEYIAAIESGLYTLAKNTAMTKLVAMLPIFASGPLNFIAVQIISRIAKWFVTEGDIVAFTYFIDLNTSAEGRAFLKAITVNHEAQTQNKSPQEKKDAEQILIDRARSFIKLSN